ncbi:MAG: hypothetical protein IPG17_16840 [Sandaracinaceae bacterium]|nr:hypothetical protein [Sandaracinaceae bacterium]
MHDWVFGMGVKALQTGATMPVQVDRFFTWHVLLQSSTTALTACTGHTCGAPSQAPEPLQSTAAAGAF